jgi:predicted ATPase
VSSLSISLVTVVNSPISTNRIVPGHELMAVHLGATTSLARLWRAQGRIGEAYELLAEFHSRFTEGHGTADLMRAGAMLEELSSGAH